MKPCAPLRSCLTVAGLAVALSILVPGASAQNEPGAATPRQHKPAALSRPSTNVASEVEVKEINFEPLAAGKNVIHLKVNNHSPEKRVFGIHIYTRSFQPSGRYLGWGRPYFLELSPGATASARFAFKIQEPFSDDSTILLRFYSLASADQYDYEKFNQAVTNRVADLKRRVAPQNPLPRASEQQTRIAREVLKQVQSHLRDGRYPEACQLFTQDYRDSEQIKDAPGFKSQFQGTRAFYFWDKDEFLGLQPQDVLVDDASLRLEARREDQTWTFSLVKEAGQWKIDSVSGFKLAVSGWDNWTERLLPKLQKRSTPHFDIYYFTNSTAQRQIEDIARRREDGLVAICSFLRNQPAERIRLVLFEDGWKKRKETGHEGDGWATGRTMVEVYNERTQLNPYHETIHVVAGELGSPPALLTEGLAVYLSERLGAKALKDLGGGDATLNERCAQLMDKDEWIALRELLTYTEIGSERSRSSVAYPLSGGFVKFLVDRYNREKFLQAYRTLRNSSDQPIHKSNAQAFQRIYNLPIEQLEQEWRQTLKRRSAPGKNG